MLLGVSFLLAVNITELDLVHSLPPRYVEILLRPSCLQSDPESPHLAENSHFPWISMLSGVESLLKLHYAHFFKSGTEEAHRHSMISKQSSLKIRKLCLSTPKPFY